MSRPLFPVELFRAKACSRPPLSLKPGGMLSIVDEETEMLNVIGREGGRRWSPGEHLNSMRWQIWVG